MQKGFQSLVLYFPLLCLLPSFLLPQSHQWILAIQVIGLSALGLFIVSIYQNRAPR
jgi:hypothetical protein